MLLTLEMFVFREDNFFCQSSRAFLRFLRWCVPTFDVASDAQEKNMENGSSFEKHSPAIGAMFSISGAPLVTPHTKNISAGYSGKR